MESQKRIPQQQNDLISKIENSIQNHKKVTMGKYVFLQKLGGGAYGNVYKAIHLDNEKNFAIKIIDKQALLKKNRDPYIRQVLQRLLKSEGLLMQQCQSPHVVKCYEIKENSKYKIFVLQFCNRGSLYDELKKRKAFPVNDALAILKQMIIGLAELHKNRIIHRDLKAQNIMINNGKYKIADFGFSKQINDQNAIAQHTVLGTRVTMAPQVQAGKRYGIKADIWSLGIIFYTMISSGIELESQNGTARFRNIQEQIINKKQLFFETLDGRPNAQLKKFIKEMLTIDQAQRISWRELINHKIFERTKSNIFSSVILNVKLNQDKKVLKELQNIPSYLENNNQEGLLAKQHEKLVIQEGNKFQKKNQRPQEQIGSQSQNQKETNKQQTPKPEYQSESKISEYLKQLNLQINPISNLNDFKQLQNKSDIEKQIFRQIQLNNLQCHKAQYIYEKIIAQIEQKNMLNLQKRSHHQLLYLLITRCWINVSWAMNNLQKFKDNEMMVNYHEQLGQMYKRIEQKWKKVASQLFQVENLLKYKLKDIGSSVFARQSQKDLKKFISGIQTEDYTKEQQIQFTKNVYIEKVKNELKAQNRDLFIMTARMNTYEKVNKIKLEELEQQGLTFQVKVRKYNEEMTKQVIQQFQNKLKSK